MVICLQSPTVFCIGGRTISLLLNVHRVRDVRQIDIHTTEPLIPEPSPFDTEIAIAKLRRYKSPGSDKIPGELIQGGGEVLRSKEG
jgi:hypothetical protein